MQSQLIHICSYRLLPERRYAALWIKHASKQVLDAGSFNILDADTFAGANQAHVELDRISWKLNVDETFDWTTFG